MVELLTSNSFFCIFLTLSAFEAGRMMQQKWKSPLLNPLLIGSVLACFAVKLLGIPVTEYQKNCAPLQFLLTPATICFAISLYEQIGALKKHLGAILLGVLCGTAASLLSIHTMAKLFGLDEVLRVSLLPKSITTAIGMALSEEAGGIGALTAAVIIITGILGNIFGESLCKLFRIQHPIAQGVALGTASHAIGTSKANELSQLTGAVSSMSLTVAGLMTVVLFSFLVG